MASLLRRVWPAAHLDAQVLLTLLFRGWSSIAGMAAGLARAGFRPFVYGLSSFIPVRVVEQIKLDIAHVHLHVVLIGDDAGFVYSHLCTSHQSTEDIACTRAIADLYVYSLAARFKVSACMHMAYQTKAPVYLCMGKSDRGDVHAAVPPARVGSLLNAKPEKTGGIALIATGSLVRTAITITTRFHLDAAVWSAPYIKPIDSKQVSVICERCGAEVVLEQFNMLGGLGSVITDIALQFAPMRILRVGVRDRFSQHCGSHECFLKEHSLDRPAIEQRVRDFLTAN